MEDIIMYITEKCQDVKSYLGIIDFKKEGINYQIKYEGDKINYLIKEDENNKLEFKMSVKWSDQNEFLGVQTNSILDQNCDYTLEQFIAAIS